MSLPPTLSGDRLGSYRIEEVLGRGGMGVVYRATDLRLGRQVALKLLSAEYANDPRFRERFLRESRAAASIDHPGVLPVFEAGEVDGLLFIAMRLVRGEDLARLLRREGALEPVRAVALVQQLADALDVTHAGGLVHRDVKPSNILLAREGAQEHAYLTDFGITKLVAAGARLTESGGMIGTVDYAAPEVLRGEEVDGRADVYALGCVLYEMLVGAVPYPRDSAAAAVYAHLEESPPGVSAQEHPVPSDFDDVIARALAKAPGERYASAGELAAAAVAALEPAGAMRRRRRWVGRPRAAVLAGAAAVGLAVLVAAIIASRGTVQRPVPANAAVEIDGDKAARAIAVGSDPGAATAGGGFVWTASGIDGTVSRVDPRSGGVQTLDVGAEPAGMSYGAGSLWVGVAGKRSIVRVNPGAAKAVGRFFAGNGLAGLAYGGGAVWAAASLDGTVVRVDPTTGRRREIPVGAAPGPVVYSDGGVWVGLTGAGTVARIDPRSAQVTQSVAVGNNPSALAAGGGSVWVANTDDGTVSRIDSRTGTVTATASVGQRPRALAVIDDQLWVALSGEDALVKLDVRRAAIVQKRTLGVPPGALAVQGRHLWVTTLTRERTHRGGTLRTEFSGFARCECLDPRLVGYLPESMVFDLVYDGLVALRRTSGPAGAQLVGDLATGVPRPDASGKTYVFRLRRGVRFSNGAPVRASDVRASFTRLLSHPSDGSWTAGIVGAGGCRPSHCDLSRGIAADDAAGIVTFHLERADPDFPYRLAQPFASVVPRQAGAKIGHTPIAGTGPYRITTFHAGPHGVRIELTRNPRFQAFAPDAAPDGYPARIAFTMRPPPKLPPTIAKQTEPVLTGGADVTFLSDGSFTAPSARGVSALAVHHAAQLRADGIPATLWAVLNTRVAPFDDERVRRALDYAVDRRRVATLRGGPVTAAPTCQMIPPGLPGYRPVCPYTAGPATAGTWQAPDLRLARQLVADSGTRGQKVLVWGIDRIKPVSEYLASVLRGLGYRARTHIVDLDEYYSHFADPRTRPQIGLGQWTADYPAASNMLESFFCSSAANWSGLCDREVERAAASARRAEVGSAEAARRWAAVDRRLVDIAAAVPLINPRTVALISTRVHHYVFHTQLGPLLDQLQVR